MGSHRPHRRFAALVTALAVLGAGLPVGAAAAQASPESDVKKAEIAAARAAAGLEDATERAQRAGARYFAATAALPAARDRVIAARGRVVAAQVAADTARRKATTARADYDAVAARFDAAQARVDDAQHRLEGLAAQSYKTPNIGGLSMVLGARDGVDALARLSYLDRVLDNQHQAIRDLDVARRAARIAQDESGAAKRLAEDAEADAEAKLGTARAAEAEAAQAVRDVLTLRAERRTALIAAQAERAASLAKFRLAKLEEDRLVAQLRRWQDAHGGPTLRPGARLLMPARGWKSSDYGMRFHPLFGMWRLHSGMDIAASGGTPIRAAADGTVVRAGWSGGYGLYTCISHGKQGGRGISTCYGHQSDLDVSSGQYVRRGQIIGNVGSTGNSTGAHLHFEVRVDGAPRNPANWLPACLC